MTLARAVPALIVRDDPIPGNQPRGHYLPLTRMTGQAVQQHDRLLRPARSRQTRRTPSRTTTRSNDTTTPPGPSDPDHAPTTTSRPQGRPSRRRAAMKHRPRPRRRCPATAAGQLPLSDPGGSITVVNASTNPRGIRRGAFPLRLHRVAPASPRASWPRPSCSPSRPSPPRRHRPR
jgi:hypothetical protein